MEQKRQEEEQIFKKGRAQAGSRPGFLRKGGAIRCSCFMFQQPSRGEIFRTFGKGREPYMGGGGFAACCLQNTLLLAKIDSILISENLINILINAENTKKNFLPFC